MNTLKLLAVCIATATFFSSCDELKGTINVSAPINVVKDKKTYTIGVGSHKANIKVKKENLINFEVKTLSGEKDIKIVTNFNAKRLYDGQQFNIPSHVSGQPFDITGSYTDKTTYSETINTWESCTYTERERHCSDVYYPPVCRTERICDPKGNCHTREYCTGGGYRYECRDIDITRHGQQDVSYYNSYNKKAIELNIIVANQQNGRVFADDYSTDRIYNYKGLCR